MRVRNALLVILVFLFQVELFPQRVADLVKIDSLKKYVRDLSGDKTFRLNNVPYFIKTRNTAYPLSDINTAAMYIKSKFEDFGLTAYEQPFSFTYSGALINAKNIYAVQTGSQFPDKKYIICAHYDDMPFTGGIAPGADDNASGTAAVIEAARVISQLNPKYTIVYIAFSGEEQGLKGSWYYASIAANNNDDILGVINLDMIAWDKDGDNNVDIYYNTLTNGKQYLMDKNLDMLSTVNQIYNINMTISKFSFASGNSDHYPFLQNGYPSFLMIEEFSDFNTEYHKTTDLFSSLYYDYFEKCSKLAICTLAELARTANALVVENNKPIPTDFTLYQNYPNPFNPSTIISYRIPDAAYVKLKIYDSLGREVKTLVDEFQQTGEHKVPFSILDKSLTSGIYFYTLQAGNRYFTKKMIYLK